MFERSDSERTFLETFGPLGVLDCKADGKGGQTIENSGPLTKKRMETIDDGQVVAARYDDWKVVFLENRGEAFGFWREPLIELRVPLLFHLRIDPFEGAQHNANVYEDWFLDHPFIIVPIQMLSTKFLLSMKEYPPSQSPGAFNLSKIEEMLKNSGGSH